MTEPDLTQRTALLERLLTAVVTLRTAWTEDADTASLRIAAAKEEVASITAELHPQTMSHMRAELTEILSALQPKSLPLPNAADWWWEWDDQHGEWFDEPQLVIERGGKYWTETSSQDYECQPGQWVRCSPPALSPAPAVPCTACDSTGEELTADHARTGKPCGECSPPAPAEPESDEALASSQVIAVEKERAESAEARVTELTALRELAEAAKAFEAACDSGASPGPAMAAMFAALARVEAKGGGK